MYALDDLFILTSQFTHKPKLTIVYEVSFSRYFIKSFILEIAVEFCLCRHIIGSTLVVSSPPEIEVKRLSSMAAFFYLIEWSLRKIIVVHIVHIEATSPYAASFAEEDVTNFETWRGS